ncbi:MAG: Asp-tRNA(Asn)/Glu-tRNA(Gln) amidotransferase subunit GatA [Fuerstiella sp.]|jgi:aspartyl-tRNA(Asn)/glutamyl-tRNA(Gln) amidotransferase subunit A|nr:Asp-tRNA(Asn)/Glu-tRNA(Gln) amidotransferase subunit GatA [Fuerstiella sp.]
MPELYEQSTESLLSALNAGDLSSRTLTTACLDRIDQLNKKLNAFVSVNADAALAKADAVDKRRATGQTIGLLQGLPVGVKDNICQAGVATTCGSRMLHNYCPPYDAHVVEQLNAEDGVIVGQLNMDEFAMGSSTETSASGVTRNPWNPEHSPGGSSGGAAAAVAAGMVPLALGSDTGGSIRQPASFCGVVGMKPTYGRVSRFGLVAFASSLDQIGPFARDVHGAALLLQVISGHDTRDTTSVDSVVANYTGQFNQSLEGLRIGIVDEHYGEGLDDEVEAAVRRGIERLESAGATVKSVKLPHARYSVATYYLIAPSEASSNLARYDGIHYGHRTEDFNSRNDGLIDLYCRSRGEGFGAEVKRRIMLGTYALSAGYYDAYYLKALKVRRRIREDFDKAFAEVDIIAGPVAPTAAFRIGEKMNDPLAMYLSDIYTISANLAGIPGISVPCGLTTNGLPIGLQLQASTFSETTLLQAAAMAETSGDTIGVCPVA